AEVVLARVVRAVGEPEADDRRAELPGDLDALQAVVEGESPHARIGMTHAPEPVVVLAEEVRVDRADADAALLGVAPQRLPVVDAVPGDVEGDGRAAAREPVHEGRVVDALPHAAGRARPGV